MYHALISLFSYGNNVRVARYVIYYIEIFLLFSPLHR